MALANLLVLLVLLAAGELIVRVWREGGVVAGLRSFVNDQPMPRHLGTGNWLCYDESRGYTLRAGENGVNALHVRHGPIAEPKPQGDFRILLLGDSVAWPETGFVARLRRSLGGVSPRIEVINAAVPGYTTFQERHHLEQLCEPVDPDVVVLQYCLNDNHRFLHQLTDDGGWLITEEARRALLPEGGGVLAAVGRWSYLALELRQRLFSARRATESAFAWEADPAFAAAWRADSWALVEGEIAHMNRHLAVRGVPFVLVAVPYEPQLMPAALDKDSEYTMTPQRRLAALCRAQAVPLLDLHPTFLPRRGDALYTDGIHLSDTGHELVARTIESFLRELELLPQ